MQITTMQTIIDTIRRRQRIGWKLTRLHITRHASGFEARVGWRASTIGLEPSETIDPMPGVTAYEWQAPDDDLIRIATWNTENMRQLCQTLGIAEFDYQRGESHEAWLGKIR